MCKNGLFCGHTHTHTEKIAQKASQLFWNLITEPRRWPIINYSSVINEVCGLHELRTGIAARGQQLQ